MGVDVLQKDKIEQSFKPFSQTAYWPENLYFVWNHL